DRSNFVRRLRALAEETRTPIYAWALMSNHVHILLCSGALGLAKFMRRLLTGYAVSYNLRHRRHGHVFQNRYKSIVCDARTQHYTDRMTGEKRRHHLHESVLQRAVRDAVVGTGIAKPASCHTFRHSFATHLKTATIFGPFKSYWDTRM
ncbi:MAG: transposase, partial [Methyloceanibacter sp.]